MADATNQLSRLITLDAYQESRAHLFPSPSSVHWFTRTHRDQLVKASALMVINGRHVIDPDVFDGVVLSAGQAKLVGA